MLDMTYRIGHLRCAPGLALAVFALLGAGCSMNKIAADTAGSVAAASSVHMRGFWDYDIAGHGNAAGIMQLESMYGISPDNEDLALMLCQSEMGYAFGWVEVAAEKAEDAGDYDEAERQRKRAALLYRRARDVALRAMRNRDDGIDAAIKAKPEELTAYLQEHYSDAETDAAPVFWTAAAWGGLLGMSDDMSLAIDFPALVAMMKHVIALQEDFEGASALVFLGGFNAQFPAQFGGSVEKGKEYFERALKITGRRAHQVQLNYARLYALTVNDKELFLSLLHEIIEAPDQGNDVRLANKIARVRAQLLLSKVDMLL